MTMPSLSVVSRHIGHCTQDEWATDDSGTDPAAADAIPSQRKQGLFKTIIGYVTRRKDDGLPSSHVNVQEYNIAPNVGLSSSLRTPYASSSLDSRKML